MLEKGAGGGGRRQGEVHGEITRLGIARGGDTGEGETRSERYISEAGVFEVDVCVCVRVFVRCLRRGGVCEIVGVGIRSRR